MTWGGEGEGESGGQESWNPKILKFWNPEMLNPVSNSKSKTINYCWYFTSFRKENHDSNVICEWRCRHNYNWGFWAKSGKTEWGLTLLLNIFLSKSTLRWVGGFKCTINKTGKSIFSNSADKNMKRFLFFGLETSS